MRHTKSFLWCCIFFFGLQSCFYSLNLIWLLWSKRKTQGFLLNQGFELIFWWRIQIIWYIGIRYVCTYHMIFFLRYRLIFIHVHIRYVNIEVVIILSSLVLCEICCDTQSFWALNPPKDRSLNYLYNASSLILSRVCSKFMENFKLRHCQTASDNDSDNDPLSDAMGHIDDSLSQW